MPYREKIVVGISDLQHRTLAKLWGQWTRELVLGQMKYLTRHIHMEETHIHWSQWSAQKLGIKAWNKVCIIIADISCTFLPPCIFQEKLHLFLTLRDEQPPRAGGRLPLRLQPHMRNSSRYFNSPSDEGKDPLSWGLPYKCKTYHEEKRRGRAKEVSDIFSIYSHPLHYHVNVAP